MVYSIPSCGWIFYNSSITCGNWQVTVFWFEIPHIGLIILFRLVNMMPSFALSGPFRVIGTIGVSVGINSNVFNI
jgi:hypothetical protein